MGSELKPCPFCGANAKVQNFGGGRYAAFCENIHKGTTETTKKEAAKSWNTRAVPASQPVTEVVRYDLETTCMAENKTGAYVEYDQHVAAVSFGEAAIKQNALLWKRIEAAEAKIAQSEKQGPIGHIVVDEQGAIEQSAFKTSLGFEQGVHNLYFYPVASDAELRAERDRFKQALEAIDKNAVGSMLPCSVVSALVEDALNPSESLG